MHYPGYNTGDVILSEGEWYPFRIHNLVQLQDHAWYYVLQDPNGLKHFMPAEFYMNYGLNTGDAVLCKIDRINCTGRIFIEPEHPLYRIGEIYPFDLVAGPADGSADRIIVSDLYKNCIEVPVYDKKITHGEAGVKVMCKVLNIKKGKPILEISINNSLFID